MGAGQPEIGQFEFADFADEQILRLEIPVEDLAPVDVREATQELKQEQTDVVSL